jgi:Tfp pilus assembly protein PilN
MTEPTPYRPQGRRASRLRTVLIVLGAVVVVVAGLALHLAGVLPPE